MLNDRQRKIQDDREIDFSKWMNTDDLNNLQCKLKGLTVIQYSLSADYDSGCYVDGKYVFEVIADNLNSIVKDIEKLKPQLNYMDSFARVGTDELIKRGERG